MTRIAELTQRLTKILGGSVQAARQEVRWMRQHLESRSTMRHRKSLPDNSLVAHRQLEQLLRQRVDRHRPLQYLLQTQPFCDLDFSVRSPVLIPRVETEQWTRYVGDRLTLRDRHQGTAGDPGRRATLTILDVGCGSGCIGISLVHRLRQSQLLVRLLGMDCSASAVRLARLNARKLLSDTVEHSRTRFVQADLFALDASSLPPATDGPLLLVSNPPYVSDSEYAELEPSVRLWEDRRALVGGRQEPNPSTSTSTSTPTTTTATLDSHTATTPLDTQDSREFTNPDGLRYYHRLLELWLSVGGQQLRKPSTGGTQLAPWKRVSCLDATDLPIASALLDPPALPSLALEYGGRHQTDALLQLFRPHLSRVEILVDYYGQDRCLLGYA